MSPEPAILTVEGLTRNYFGLRAVDDLSISVRQGSIFGLIGPNGSGKSTTIDCVSGFQKSDGGRCVFAGADVTGLSPQRLSGLGLTRTFQTVRSYEELSLRENLMVAAQEGDGLSLWDALRRNGRCRAADRAARDRADELLDVIGLARLADAPAEVLSYGQRKLLAIAASVMTRPRIILLDEPVAGVNPTMIERVKTVIRQINADGVAFLIVEHNVDFIMGLCERVAVMESGRKIAEGEPSLIRRDRRVLEAYLGRRGAADAAVA